MKTEYDQNRLDLTHERALEWLDALIHHHEDAVKILKERRENFKRACKGGTSPVNVLSWTVNDVNNIQRNCRLDLAVNHAAEIAAAKERLES